MAPFVPETRVRAVSAASGTVAAAMTFLADLERLLERVFERSSARLFRTRIQVIQLEHRVERAMEHGRLAEDRRTTVPSRYRVRLTPRDLAAVAEQAGGADALAGRLADSALAFARSHGYHLRGRPTVSLVADPTILPGVITVDAMLPEVAAPASPRPVPAGSPAVPEPPVGASLDAPVGAGSTPGTPPGPAPSPLPEPLPSPAEEPAFTGVRGDGTHTLVFRRPLPPAPRAHLRVFAPDGGERTVEVDGTRLTIGRAHDNGLVLDDARVSRHHGQLQARYGALVYTDLGSTNGTRVNGIRVDEIVLGAGDRLLVGDTVLVVETLPG
jgi:hypothetical protein